jgi:non-homologous end joining protein Ku
MSANEASMETATCIIQEAFGKWNNMTDDYRKQLIEMLREAFHAGQTYQLEYMKRSPLEGPGPNPTLG